MPLYASPEIVTALALLVHLPLTRLPISSKNDKGENVKLPEPKGDELPSKGFDVKDRGLPGTCQRWQQSESACCTRFTTPAIA